jgi:hypothetical protein
MAVSRAILDLVQPAVTGLAGRLFVLTEGRRGARSAKPNIFTFYETALVHALYETMLMSPKLDAWDIRIEEKENGKWIDLWLRRHDGGRPIRIEAGDLPQGVAGKANSDARKLRLLDKGTPAESNWILCFVRDLQKEIDANKRKNIQRVRQRKRRLLTDGKALLQQRIKKSLVRVNGLDPGLLRFEPKLIRVFTIYRPGAKNDVFGVALLRVRP